MVSRRVYFSVINNAVYVAFGPVLTILGAYMMFFYRKFEPFVDELTWMMPMVFMILGIFTIVLAIFACLQLATEFVVTAVCYFIFVVALILLLIGAGAFWVNISPSYPSFVNNTFDRAYNSFDDYRIHQSWGLLQSELQCCGMNGMSDFESLHKDIPIECCKNKTVAVCDPDDVILEGCLHAFLYRVYLDRTLLGIVAILAGALMLAMLVGSVFLCFDNDDDVDALADDGYCIDDEADAEYYVMSEGRSEKHPPFAGRNLTFVPEHNLPGPSQPMLQSQTPPGPSMALEPYSPPIIEEPATGHVLENQTPSESNNHHHLFGRVARKLPMFETKRRRSRMKHCSPRTGNCRRCAHVSKCKMRRRGLSLLDSNRMRTLSQVSIHGRRLSHSPEHHIMEAPKANSNFYCQRMPDGRTICRATPI